MGNLKRCYSILSTSHKQRLYQALENPRLNYFDIGINFFLMLVLSVNISINIAQIFYDIHHDWLSSIQNWTIGIFIMELLIRFYAANSQRQYRGFQGVYRFLMRKYTLVDVLALLPSLLSFFNVNILFIRLIRFLVFLRLLRVLRVQKIIRKFIRFESFATSNIATKVFILFLFSVLFVYLFQYAYKDDSLNTSIAIFLDPPALVEAPNGFERIVGTIELIIGLFISGTLISIITSLLLDFTYKVHKGLIPYRGKNHLIIINNSPKLKYILDELDLHYHHEDKIQDVVLILPNMEDFEHFRSNLPHYEHMDIFCVYGEILNINTYTRANLEHAQRLVMLVDNNDILSTQRNAVFIRQHFDLTHIHMVIETVDSEVSDMIYNHIFMDIPHYITVNHNKILNKILKRSVVDYRYFHLYAKLFSFEGYTPFIESNMHNESFQSLCMQCTKGVVIGYVHAGEMHINPMPNTEITTQDHLVYIADHKGDLQLFVSTDEHHHECQKLKIPTPVENRKVLFLGCFHDINIQDVSEFLSGDIAIDPVNNLDELFNEQFWMQIKRQNYDIVIFNLEDNLEFKLTLYLRALFNTAEDKPFLSKIINIIADPTQAELLVDRHLPNNFILSEKIVAQYLSIVLFHGEFHALFDELTSIKGNEIYIVDTCDYQAILGYSFPAFKQSLQYNGMLYLGSYIDGMFEFNSLNYASSQSMVVLFKGEKSLS